MEALYIAISTVVVLVIVILGLGLINRRAAERHNEVMDQIDALREEIEREADARRQLREDTAALRPVRFTAEEPGRHRVVEETTQFPAITEEEIPSGNFNQEDYTPTSGFVPWPEVKQKLADQRAAQEDS